MSGNHSEETTAKMIGEKRLPDEEKNCLNPAIADLFYFIPKF